MRVGAVFPQTEIGNDPGDIRRWATAVEELGYNHILAYDHVLGASTDRRPDWHGYTSEDPFHEVFVLFGYLAAITRTVELATGVLVLPQRQTALVAKQAAEVDVLSGGRLRLGIGIGWNEVEYGALGESFGDRGARSEEQVGLMRELWSTPVITHAGRWHHVDSAGINPRPAAGMIPVWLGGSADQTLRRVARIGDGWLPTGEPDRARDKVERLRGYARRAGRQPGDIGIEARLNLGAVRPADRAGYAGQWRDLGATHLTVNTMGAGHTTVSGHLGALRDAIGTLEGAGLAG